MTPERQAELESEYQRLEGGGAPLASLLYFRRVHGLPELPELVARASAVPPPPARPRGVTKLKQPGKQFQVRKRPARPGAAQRFDPTERHDLRLDLRGDRAT